MKNEPGLAPLSAPPSLADLERDERVDAMVEWFFENFEDPAQETPYNGREGGYLYIHGGPYEAESYIPNAFPEATEEEHTEAIERIEADGPEFAPAGHRVLAPEDYSDDIEQREPPPPLDYRLDVLTLQIDTIGKHVEEILAIQRREKFDGIGLGHNNPPEPFEDEFNLSHVMTSIRDLRIELAKPNRENAANEAVIEEAQGRFSRLKLWLDDLVKKSPAALALGAVGGAGKHLYDYAVAHHAELEVAITGAISTMGTWLHYINPAF